MEIEERQSEIKNQNQKSKEVIMETLFKDIRYGVRSLLKRPGFTVIALVTPALTPPGPLLGSVVSCDRLEPKLNQYPNLRSEI